MKAIDFKAKFTIVEIDEAHKNLEVKGVFYKHEAEDLDLSLLNDLNDEDCFIEVNYCNRANEAFSYTKKEYLEENV